MAYESHMFSFALNVKRGLVDGIGELQKELEQMEASGWRVQLMTMSTVDQRSGAALMIVRMRREK